MPSAITSAMTRPGRAADDPAGDQNQRGQQPEQDRRTQSVVVMHAALLRP